MDLRDPTTSPADATSTPVSNEEGGCSDTWRSMFTPRQQDQLQVRDRPSLRIVHRSISRRSKIASIPALLLRTRSTPQLFVRKNLGLGTRLDLKDQRATLEPPLPVVRIKFKIKVNFAICWRTLSHGEFDCDFDLLTSTWGGLALV